MLDSKSKKLKKIFFAGSSHTSFFFISVKSCLKGKAIVSKFPHYAGNTAEMLDSLGDWSIEDKDIVHVYAGHRDLMLNETGQPIVNNVQFEKNLAQIVDILLKRTTAKIVFSDIPPVHKIILKTDPQRNQRISHYNKIIKDVTRERNIQIHDFSAFALSYSANQEIYSDGLHFTRKFYKDFGIIYR